MNYLDGSTSFIGTTEDIKTHRLGDLVDGYLPVRTYRVGLVYNADPTGAFAVHYIDFEVVTELPAEPEVIVEIAITKYVSPTDLVRPSPDSGQVTKAPATGDVTRFAGIGLFIITGFGITVLNKEKNIS